MNDVDCQHSLRFAIGSLLAAADHCFVRPFLNDDAAEFRIDGVDWVHWWPPVGVQYVTSCRLITPRAAIAAQALCAMISDILLNRDIRRPQADGHWVFNWIWFACTLRAEATQLWVINR